MKSFNEYLTESKKTYSFKIKIAGELSEGFKESLNTAMERFSVISVSNGKRTPIQEVPLDFPHLKNKEVTVFDVEVNYPTTPQVLESYIASVCGCGESCIVVRTGNEPSEQYQAEIAEKESAKDKTALLNQDYNKEDNQSLAGEVSKMNLLKDLLKVKNAGEAYTGVNDVLLSKDVPTGEKAAEMPEGDKTSPIGSKGK
jgi:hypothetical protein